MLADEAVTTTAPETVESAQPSSRRRVERSTVVARVAAFLGALGLVLVYALRGGSYDLVVFQEHGLVIWWVLAIGIAVGLLPRARPSRPALVLLGALLAYALWTAVSLTWTESAERTTVELARVLDYLGLVALLSVTLGRDNWRAGAAGLAFGALVVCALAVGSRLAPSVFGTDHAAATLHIDRLSSPFGYWNAVAAWGAMSTAIGLAWSAHDRSRIGRAVALALVPVACLTTYLTYSRAGLGGTLLAVLAVLAFSRSRLTVLIHTVVAAAGAALAVLAVRGAPEIARATGTRGSATVLAALVFAAALCAGVAVLTGLHRADKWRIPRPVVRPLAIAGVVAVIGAGAVIGPGLVRHAWHSFTHTTSAVSSTDPTARLASLSGTRYPVWKVALKAFDAHPVGGNGAGTFEFWWNRHATDPEFVRDAHNLWLQNMAELGAPGLLLIIALTISALALGVAVRRRVRRSASAGATAAFLSAFVVYLLHASVDWMWESTAVTVLALAGVAAVGARLGSRRFRLRWPARAALVLLAAVAGLVQVPGLISTTAIRRSQAAERTGNGDQALAWARLAVNAEPWSASAYEQRGLVLESAGRLPAAAQDLQRATSHESTDFSHWLIRARIETERGRLAAATSDYQRAHRLRPLAAVFALAPFFKGTGAGP
ncbi:MAG: hypothetical protein DLM64_13180 [Solirubrobacterales bacterium]|nr:MAG: hypothetical protein DLM64_13180 [Solirubrobacterales bacterium]